ncbi:hypothetical protein [Roseospirillum parvum]|uniref:Mu-like prophage major head subunit gpT n=1 Tax=Roseospirillum parvum TaxID=83401 RepID=A0A1G8EXF8_9PROT|nr:hypothetical protein [Roseospirillum parvum]SDH74593.1 hypothetical protein SAMN05421742_11172 [Roseospirillum parvum]
MATPDPITRLRESLADDYPGLEEATPGAPGQDIEGRQAESSGAILTERGASGAAAVLPPGPGGRTGTRFEVRVIQAGLSGNGNLYPPAVLREAVADGLFDQVKVLVKPDRDHLAGHGKHPEAVLGRLVEARWVDGANPDTEGEVRAVLEVLASAGTMPARMVEAVGRGMNLWGLSIDATTRFRPARLQGRPVKAATKFLKVHSVDLIVDPGAGGELLRVLEAAADSAAAAGTDHPPTASPREDAMTRDQLIALLREARPDLLEGIDLAQATLDELTARLREALPGPTAAPPAANNAGAPPATARLTEAQIRARVDEQVDARVSRTLADRDRLATLREAAAERVRASALPEPARARVIATLREAAAEHLTQSHVDQAVEAELAYLRGLGGGHVTGLGGGGTIHLVQDRAEKVREALDAFFDPTHRDHRDARSIKQLYGEITGDVEVTGNPRRCDQARLREALGSDTLANVLGDSMTRRMLADYRNQTPMDSWRRVVNVTSVPDFRTQERTRWGGYGDLPGVAEDGTYTALSSPSDEKATYAVTKRGGLESVTLEMIKNDDVGAVRRIPIKLGRAAKRTLSKFVWTLFVDNAVTTYDGVALFHASHGNLGSAALDAASVAAGRLAMLTQQELDSGEPLWIQPRALCVPAELEESAVDLFRRSTNNDRDFVESLVLDVIPVPWWADANDWMLAADPMDIPGAEIGFLDGQEEPELWVADNPAAGSLFTNDRIDYKIRHIYSGAATDHRAFYKAVVA